MSGRILLHFQKHSDRLKIWLYNAFIFLLFAGILCNFSQNNGFIPINKNLWSISFGFVSTGGGLIGLSITYILVDVLKLWSGKFAFLFLFV